MKIILEKADISEALDLWCDLKGYEADGNEDGGIDFRVSVQKNGEPTISIVVIGVKQK